MINKNKFIKIVISTISMIVSLNIVKTFESFFISRLSLLQMTNDNLVYLTYKGLYHGVKYINLFIIIIFLYSIYKIIKKGDIKNEK